MSPSKPSYHHGDLRNALVQAGLALLELGGPEAVTLRAVAREAGVSQAAPYAHFEGKIELMSSIAAVGFERLKDALAALAADSTSRLSDLGIAYVDFATRNPGLYSLMFGSSEHIDPETTDLVRASREAFDLLAAKTAREGSESRFDPAPIAAWSLVHGLSMLMINRRLPPHRHEMLPEILKILEPGVLSRLE